MDREIAAQWCELVACQRELVKEYLLAVGRRCSPQTLAYVRRALACVAHEVEACRHRLPDMPFGLH